MITFASGRSIEVSPTFEMKSVLHGTPLSRLAPILNFSNSSIRSPCGVEP